jgi:hypothetical protein
MYRHTPISTKAKAHINPLVKIYVWRCADEKCKYDNETLASEEGYVRILTSGNELREAMWYAEKCEKCRQIAGKGCCLLQVKLIDPVDKRKGKTKAPADEDVEMGGRSDKNSVRKPEI